MIYEFRTYEAAEGRLEDLNRRFRELTVDLFARHGFRPAGFWVPEDSNQLVYLLVWKDKDECATKWKAFQSDPDWRRGKQASEERGPLIASTNSRFWNPTSYCPVPV